MGRPTENLYVPKHRYTNTIFRDNYDMTFKRYWVIVKIVDDYIMFKCRKVYGHYQNEDIDIRDEEFVKDHLIMSIWENEYDAKQELWKLTEK